MILEDIVNSLFKNNQALSLEENNKELNGSFLVDQLAIGSSNFKAQLRKILPRDFIEIEIFHRHTERVNRLVNLDSVDTFFIETKENLEDKDESDETRLEINIKKNITNGKVSIYSLSSIIEYWSKDGAFQCLERLEKLSNFSTHLECPELLDEIQTSLFHFAPLNQSVVKVKKHSPEETILKRDKNISFSNHQNLRLTPEDLKPCTGSNKSELYKILTKCSELLSIIYIADQTRVELNGSIDIKLNGYKSLTLTLKKITDIPADNAHESEIFEIYSWIYSEAKISDKLGLARNLISLHAKESLLDLQRGCLNSIFSNYQIYLKENLKQYIDVKNKISESIQKLSDRATDLTKQIGTYLRISIFSIYSFFLTAFIIRSINKDTLDLQISNSLYITFLAFMAVSIAIFFYAKSEYEHEKARFKSSYISLKNRYSDLISPSDLIKILQNDSDHSQDLIFLEESFSRTKKLWTTMLVTIFIAITLLKFFA